MDQLTHRGFAPPVPEPPPASLPFRGFLRAIRENALRIWPEAAYRQDVTIRHMLGRTNVLLCAPDAIHRVLVDNHTNYRRSAASIRILRPITGRGLLLSEGEEWRLQRRTIAPALAPRVIPLLCRHIIASAAEAIETLGETADMLAFMQSLALDIAGRSMFSIETRQFGPAMRRLLTEFGEKYARASLFDMMMPPSIPAPRDFGRARFSKRWMHLIESIMESRMAHPAAGGGPRDLFDLLRDARDPETGGSFSPTELRDQIATLILAGHETTAVTLFWACTLLARDPAAQAWLAEETAAIDPADEDALTKLVRTRAVVNETLRLFPPAFLLVREAIGPDNAGGVAIPRRAVVMIAPWVLHRHHKLWSDPAVFDPSRFMPGAPPPPRFAFMPFGAGPRICVGAQFAMAEAILALAMLTRRFQFAIESDRPVLPVAVVTTQPDHAPVFRLTRRA